MLAMFLAMLDTPEEKIKFEDLYNRYRDMMYNYACKILKDIYLAEDAVHNSFMSVIKRLEKIPIDNSDETQAYLLVTVRNASIAILNRKNKIIDMDIENIEDDTDLELEIETEYCRQRVWDLIMDMDKIYSDTLALKLFYGLSNTEIADIMKTDIDVVNMRVYRARKKLKEKLMEENLYDKR